MGTNCAPLHFKLNGIDAINKITKPRIIQWKDIIYIAEREITFHLFVVIF
jgi:hypothetical protein